MKIWIFLDGKQQGPLTLDELRGLPITPETKVWFAGLPKWYPAGSLDELKSLFEEPSSSEAEEVFVEEQVPAVPEPPVVPQVPEAAPAPEPAVTNEDEPSAQPAWAPVQAPISQAPVQPTGQFQQAPPCPPTYLIWNIILTVLCCTPFAVFGIISAILTGNAYNRGDHDGAKRWSEIGAWMVMLSFAFGALPSMLISLLYL